MIHWLPPSRVKQSGKATTGGMLFPDKPVEAFRQVLAKTGPIRVRQAASCETYKVDKQGQSLSVMPGRNVNVHDAHRRITSILLLRAWLSIVTRLTEPIDPKNLRICLTSGFADIISGRDERDRPRGF